MALGAAPTALPTTVSLLASAADDLWWAAGDRSVDLSWYTRRALLMGISATTEVYMLTDHSPGHRETWAFLERSLEEVRSGCAKVEDRGELCWAAGKGALTIAEGVLGVVRPLVINKDGDGFERCLPKTAPFNSNVSKVMDYTLKGAEAMGKSLNLPDPLTLLSQFLPPSVNSERKVGKRI